MDRNGWNSTTLVLLLAGGKGERLYPLTKNHSKPAVWFGGMYRIIDFTLSNCLNSGLKRIYVLTQHKSLSLDRHIRAGWSILHPELGEFIQTVPPQLQLVSRWYSGTADAVFHNLHLLEAERPQNILILSGDHVYRLDYDLLLHFHTERDADLTIACTEAPRCDATRLGVMEVDDETRMTGFVEKPADPVALPHDKNKSLVNMGVYVFKTEPLVRAIIADAKKDTKHDFGHNVIPEMMKDHRVFAFNIIQESPRQFHYWRDIGTVDSYFQANMELLAFHPPFDLLNTTWPVRTYHGQCSPTLLRNAGGIEAQVINSIISPGCVVSGGKVSRCVLSPNVAVNTTAVVENSILMPGVEIGAHAYVRRAIITENVIIPRNARIGYDRDKDQQRFQITDNRVVIVPEGAWLS